MFDAPGQTTAGLSALARQHDELALPAQPKLIEDMAYFAEPDAFYILGAETPVRLAGQGVCEAMAELFPLLDGSYDVAGILAHFEPDLAEDIRSLLLMLHIEGALEDGAAAPTKSALAHYFSRHLGVTGAMPSGGAAEAQLASGTLCLDPGLAEYREAFARAGLTIGDRPEAAALVMALPGTPVPEGIACLHLDPARGQIGPLVLPGDTACPACAAAQVAETSQAPLSDLVPFAVTEAQNFLSRVFRPRTLDGVLLLDAKAVIPAWRKIIREADCPACGSAGLPPETARVLTAHYGTAIRRWMPREISGFRLHIDPKIQSLVTSAAAAVPGQGDALPETRPDAPLLAQCWPIAGFARRPGGAYRRVLASAGNLGSAELLVRDASGAHRPYLGARDALGAAERLGTPADLVIRSHYSRVASKYGWRAYLYTLLDAGVMAARASRVLAGDGLAHWIDTGPGLRIGEDAAFHPVTLSLSPPRPRQSRPLVAPERGALDGLGMQLSRDLEAQPGRRVPVPAAAPEPGLRALVAGRQSGGLQRGHVPAAAARSLLQAACHRAPWADGDEVTALALIRDVVDMADGLYDLGGTDGPTLLAPVRMDEVLEGALLQREHARGHIFVVLGTDIAGRGLDLQGYKHAVLSAGWRLDHLCLAATGAGLTASPTGGFPPLVLKERLARLGLCFDPIVGFVAGGAA